MFENYYGGMNNPYMQSGYPAAYGSMPDRLAQLRGQPQIQPQMQQQMPANNPASPQMSNSPIWVQGEAGAKSYMVAPGNTVMLMDSENCVFYLKTADASGMPSMRTFDYTERMQNSGGKRPTVQQPSVDLGNYVTHQELEEKLNAILNKGIGREVNENG